MSILAPNLGVERLRGKTISVDGNNIKDVEFRSTMDPYTPAYEARISVIGSAAESLYRDLTGALPEAPPEDDSDKRLAEMRNQMLEERRRAEAAEGEAAALREELNDALAEVEVLREAEDQEKQQWQKWRDKLSRGGYVTHRADGGGAAIPGASIHGSSVIEYAKTDAKLTTEIMNSFRSAEEQLIAAQEARLAGQRQHALDMFSLDGETP